MAVPTNVRAGHGAALLAAFQTAKGTAVSDFTTSSATVLWTPDDAARADRPYWEADADLAWFDDDLVPAVGAQPLSPEAPVGTVEVLATPTSAEWLLRSNYGALAAGTFTLASQVTATRWLTLALVEDRYRGTTSTQRLVRTRDAWFPRLTIEAVGANEAVRLRGVYAARATLSQTLDAGGVTLPAVPMLPSDQRVFPTNGATLTRDPLGTNVALRARELRVTLAQGLAHEWDPAAGSFDVFKTGKADARIELVSDVGDETWQVLTNARAGTAQTYDAAFTVGAVTLRFRFAGLRFRVEELGHASDQTRPFRARARALGLPTVTLA